MTVTPEEKASLLSKDQRGSETNKIKGYGATARQNSEVKKSAHKEKQETAKKKVSLRKLFRYSGASDKILIFLGSLFAIVHGAGWPLLSVIFGSMTNTFIQQSQNNSLNYFFDNATILYQPTETTLDNENFTSSYSSKSTQASIDSTPSTETVLFTRNFTSSYPLQSSQVSIDLMSSVNNNINSSASITKILTSVTSTVIYPTMPNVLERNRPQKSAFSDNQQGFEESMNMFALYYVFIGIAVSVATFIQIICWMYACERQVYRLRQEFFYEVLRQEISWFDKHQSGELAMKLNDDLERIREGIGDKFSMFIEFSSTFISGFIVGFYKGWELTLVIMSLTPLLALSSAFLGKLISSSTVREQQKYAVAGGVAEEVLSSIETVTSLCGQKREVERYTDALIKGRTIALRKYMYMAVGIGFTFLVLYGSYALAFWYGSELIVAGKMDAGSVFTVFFAVMIGSFSLGNAVPHLTAVATAQGSAVKIFEIIDSKPNIDPYSQEGIYTNNLKADIEFHNVSFTYPSRKKIQVLKDFSLKINEGQTVALCGPSGSGKSTVVSLLLRFYDAQVGTIAIGNYNIKDLNVHWLRSIVGVVSQEPVLFDSSIAENIQYGHHDVTFHDIVQAAKMANAHSFITSLPNGYDTVVGERGAHLSGGQKQRIAIARALVRDPKILLLDEATSALDAESEGVVQRALDKARQGRTTIVIAHRLSTIKDADVIYAIENGQIVEYGTHEKLMDKEGLYYQLVMNQMFTDETGYSTSEQAGLSTSECFERSSKRRSSTFSASQEWHRHFIRLESEVEDENIEIPTATRIIKSCKPEFGLIGLGSIASVVSGATMPVFAVFYSEIFATFTLVGEELRASAFFWAMMFLVLAVATFLSMSLRTVGFGCAGERLTTRLRQMAFTNILRQDIGWFDDERHSCGKLTTRLATDVPMVKSAAGHRIGTVVSAVVTLITSIAIAFVFGWKLALALLVVVPILLAAGALEMKVLKGNQRRDAELMADAGKVASESLENVRTVQSLTLESTFFEKYVGHLLLPYREHKKHAMAYAFALAFSQGIMFFTYAAAFRLGAHLISLGDMDAINVYRVFFAMAFSAVSVGQWTSYLPDYTKAKLSAGLIFHMIEEVPTIDSYSKTGIRPKISGEISLTDVHFSYPSRKNVPVLRGITLNVRPGQTLALVGPSGCGKSTIVALIERFYDPHQGVVQVDGFDIRTINLNYLRSHIALVSQEPVLFNCSVKDNIIYGIEGKVTQGEIEKAAQMSNIHNFIMGLPMGYDTEVGERGTQLSGGQKQRIAIARALVRNPRILLLDEATSALDTESEKLVQEALENARQGRTCIIIAHRLSTIQGADCIAVIDHGKIAEAGTHEGLLQKKGTYYKLIKRQRVKH